MSEAKHTPWATVKYPEAARLEELLPLPHRRPNGAAAIYDTKGRTIVALCDAGDCNSIVKAVNAHAELAQALEKIDAICDAEPPHSITVIGRIVSNALSKLKEDK